jgi:hypothetical protein
VLGFADSSRVLPKSTGEVSQWASLRSSLVGSWKRRDVAVSCYYTHIHQCHDFIGDWEACAFN